MKLDPNKVIREIDFLVTQLKKTQKSKTNFLTNYEKVINLCEVVFSKKSDYNLIANCYLNEVIEQINVAFIDPKKGKVGEKKFKIGETKERVRKKLLKDCLDILAIMREKFVLRAKLTEE